MEGFAPEGFYLWDPWFARDKDGVLHMFFLQAPSHLPPGERHDYSAIGHAVLQRNGMWAEMSVPALGQGYRGDWDGLALWTGSTFCSPGSQPGQNVSYMLYTGRYGGDPAVQRIGMAMSPDMTSWAKMSGPVLKAGSPYSTEFGPNKLGVIGAWRDPYLFSANGQMFAAITARLKGDSPLYNGCIALASSTDMVRWTLLPPMLAPGLYDEMEVPQVVEHQNHWYIFFTCADRYRAGYDGDSGNPTVTWYCYAADNLTGKFEPVNADAGAIFSSDTTRGLRLIGGVGDGWSWNALGWEDGAFRLSDMYTVRLQGTTVDVQPV